MSSPPPTDSMTLEKIFAILCTGVSAATCLMIIWTVWRCCHECRKRRESESKSPLTEHQMIPDRTYCEINTSYAVTNGSPHKNGCVGGRPNLLTPRYQKGREPSPAEYEVIEEKTMGQVGPKGNSDQQQDESYEYIENSLYPSLPPAKVIEAVEPAEYEYIDPAFLNLPHGEDSPRFPPRPTRPNYNATHLHALINNDMYGATSVTTQRAPTLPHTQAPMMVHRSGPQQRPGFEAMIDNDAYGTRD